MQQSKSQPPQLPSFTFSVSITLPASSEAEAYRLLKGMLDSEHILKISYSIK